MMIAILIVAMNYGVHFHFHYVIGIEHLPQIEERVHRFHFHYKSGDQHNHISSYIHNPVHPQKSMVSNSSHSPSIWNELVSESAPSCRHCLHCKLGVLYNHCSLNMVYFHKLHPLHSTTHRLHLQVPKSNVSSQDYKSAVQCSPHF